MEEYRQAHQQQYRQRLAAAEAAEREALRREQELHDEEFARRLQQEEESAAASRSRANGGVNESAAGERDCLTADSSPGRSLPPEEGVRAAMRTGYSERLIDDSYSLTGETRIQVPPERASLRRTDGSGPHVSQPQRSVAHQDQARASAGARHLVSSLAVIMGLVLVVTTLRWIFLGSGGSNGSNANAV